MPPSVENGYSVSSKPIFKRLLGGFYKQKKNKNENPHNLKSKTMQCKTKTTKPKSDLVFDSVPDAPRNTDTLSDNFMDSNVNDNNDGDPGERTFQGKSESESEYDEGDQNDTPKHKGEKQNKFQTNSKKPKNEGFQEFPPGYTIQNNYNINHAKFLQVGNTYNYVNNMTCNVSGQPTTGRGRTRQKENKIQQTEAIKDLLSCNDNIIPAHLEKLKDHFGDNWKQIGEKLDFTSGELENLGKEYKTMREISYKILVKWYQKNGKSATVGKLCTALWSSKVMAAREAVKQLSLTIHLMK